MFVKVHSYKGGSKGTNFGSSSAIMEYLEKENKELQEEINQLKYEQNLEGYSDKNIVDYLEKEIEKKGDIDLDSFRNSEEKKEFSTLLNDQKELKNLLENKEYFFNSDKDLSLQDAKKLIDSGNDRLKDNESKYFMFTSNPSKYEILHIENLVTKKLANEEFNNTKKVNEKLTDLKKKELLIKHKFDENNLKHKEEFSKLSKDYSKGLMQVYADSFTRRDKDGEKVKIDETELNWVAKNESKRAFKHWEKEVQYNKKNTSELMNKKAEKHYHEDKIKDSLSRLNNLKSLSGEQKKEEFRNIIIANKQPLVKSDYYLKRINEVGENKINELIESAKKDFKKQLDFTKSKIEKEIKAIENKYYRQGKNGEVGKVIDGEIIKTDTIKTGKNNHTHYVVSKQSKSKWYKGERCKSSLDKAMEGLKRGYLKVENTKVNDLVNGLKEGEGKVNLVDSKGNDIGKEIEYDKLVRSARTDKVKKVKVYSKTGKDFGLEELEEKLIKEFKNKNILKSVYNEYNGNDPDVFEIVERVKSGDINIRLYDDNGKEVKVNSEFEKIARGIQNEKLSLSMEGKEELLNELKESVKGGEVKLSKGDKEDEYKEVVKDLKEGKSKTYNHDYKKVDGRGMSLSPNANSKGTSKKHKLNGKDVSVGFNHEKFKENAGKLFNEKFKYKPKDKELYNNKSHLKSYKNSVKGKIEGKVTGKLKGKISSKLKSLLNKELLGDVAKTERKVVKTTVSVVKTTASISNPVAFAKSILKKIGKEITKEL